MGKDNKFKLKNYNPTFEEKKKLINEHFVYEVDSLIQASKLLIVNNNKNIVLNNLVLESFLLHVRNLLEFFYDAPYKDTALAEQYVPNWKDLVLDKKEWMTNDRLNKEISHLTYSRNKVLVSEKEWNLGIIFFDLQNITKVFLKKLDKSYFDNGLIRLEQEFISDV